jgi:hypothetical protein
VNAELVHHQVSVEAREEHLVVSRSRMKYLPRTLATRDYLKLKAGDVVGMIVIDLPRTPAAVSRTLKRQDFVWVQGRCLVSKRGDTTSKWVDFTRLLLLANLVELKVEDMVRYFDGLSVMMGCYGISH